MKNGLSVRYMLHSDISQVLIISALSSKYPLTEERLLHDLQRKFYIALIAEIEKEIVGYSFYTAGEYEILLSRVAVLPSYRRQGIASRMMDWIKQRSNILNRERIRCLVHERNLVSQLFLRSQEFRAVKIKRRKQGDEYYLMEYLLTKEVTYAETEQCNTT